MHPTQFLLDKETHRKLRLMAVNEGVSMGEALREAVNLWLKEKKTKKKAGKGEG